MLCVECGSETTSKEMGPSSRCKNCWRNYHEVYRREHRGKFVAASLRWQKKHPETHKAYRSKYEAKRTKNSQTIKREQRKNLEDEYIKELLAAHDGVKNPDDVLISIKRVTILAKRTLNKLREWRKKDESNN